MAQVLIYDNFSNAKMKKLLAEVEAKEKKAGNDVEYKNYEYFQPGFVVKDVEKVILAGKNEKTEQVAEAYKKLKIKVEFVELPKENDENKGK